MLSILPYHAATAAYFKQQQSVWQFFASTTNKAEQLKEYKTHLLKNTYKFDEVSDAPLYQKLNLAREKLNVSFPVTLYQAQHTDEMNATIVYLNEEAHIVFSGKLIQTLTDEELLAILAHELSHVQLYTQLNGELEITDRIIGAIGNHPGSTAAHYETARLFKLYTEIFCDRGAYLVTGSYAPIISSLVKIATGLQTVNADSYIKQAEEIFSSDATTKTQGITHPENFIRARAIWLWHQQGPASEPIITQMIEGNTGLDELDLFKQQSLSNTTQHLIRLLLAPSWMQTPQTIALAKQYFGTIGLTGAPSAAEMSGTLEILHSNLKDYLSYVLYDFATADKDLEDIPLGYAFYLADALKLELAFANAVKKERKLTDKKTASLKKTVLAEFQKQELQTA